MGGSLSEHTDTRLGEYETTSFLRVRTAISRPLRSGYPRRDEEIELGQRATKVKKCSSILASFPYIHYINEALIVGSLMKEIFTVRISLHSIARSALKGPLTFGSSWPFLRSSRPF